ncbi:TetR/AcrR family transcriptional regulator [Embleya sp. NPDC056575]|uniref:TetR/AcrR family transcriptional regulator n=1 Tax=unclassified Embleya TaxID=2699296 RepID=UPI00367952AF
MPKVVDRAAQRRAIGAALLDLVSRNGLDDVSVRTVAVAAGRSAGAVQKYFRTKDEMVRFAAELAGEQVERRWAEVDVTGPPHEVLRRLVLTTLPLDDARRAEATVRFAFVTRAVHHPGLAATQREIDVDVRTALADWLLAAALPTHERADCEQLADAVIALSDGLAMRLLYTPDAQDELIPALDRALRALLAHH